MGGGREGAGKGEEAGREKAKWLHGGSLWMGV